MGIKKEKKKNKKIKFAYGIDEQHWVGDGFHVHGLLRPLKEMNYYTSPFVLMDYAAPTQFSKTDKQRGVGEHPHRGFETVTLAFQGEVEHLDSSGGGGVIKEGDVQWMTAGKGVVHQEHHSKEFTRKGGVFEMVQLWVNLPKKHKMTESKYQEIKSSQIPNMELGKSVVLRVIAGEFDGKKGPASTFTPMKILDIRGGSTEEIQIGLEEGTNTILFVLQGSLKISGQSFSKNHVFVYGRDGENLNFKTSEDFHGLVLNGEPIDEPVFAHGPFVMTSEEEIVEAFSDYRNGKMGSLTTNSD